MAWTSIVSRLRRLSRRSSGVSTPPAAAQVVTTPLDVPPRAHIVYAVRTVCLLIHFLTVSSEINFFDAGIEVWICTAVFFTKNSAAHRFAHHLPAKAAPQLPPPPAFWRSPDACWFPCQQHGEQNGSTKLRLTA